MVSPLWKACSDGDLQGVLALFVDATLDIEVKDQSGVTPLIEAVKNGHVEIVRALLEKGADPFNASNQGRPEQYTSDPVLFELLKAAQQKLQPNNENNYVEANEYASQPPPPAGYPYYPVVNHHIPMADPNVYYPPPHHETYAAPNGIGHLPPPEVARMIPCRYFPACRYGPQCMFAHPQPPYYQGGNMPAPPPPQYPPFDPAMGHAPFAYYAPPPPPPFQPNGAPLSPPPMHGRSPSDVVSPSQVHFPSAGPPPPGPYAPLPPNAYPHPPIPMAGPPNPPLHHQPPAPGPGPQSPTAAYPNGNPSPQYSNPDASAQYMPPAPVTNGFAEPERVPQTPGQEGYVHTTHREPRRHVGRRPSFPGKKPPCLFFPAGRCKNGDDCRFPHTLEPAVIPNHVQQPFYPHPRASRPPRAHHAHNGATSVAALEQKVANMTVNAANGVTETVKPQPTNGRPRHQGSKHQANGFSNGHKRAGPAIRPQRVPSADDFPVLPGSMTPPRTNGQANGPTAADILRAPAPRKESSEDGSRSSNTRSRAPSPETAGAATPNVVAEQKADAIPVPAPEAVAEQPQPATIPLKMPVSFAAAASQAASTAPEVAPRVAISA